MRTLIDLLDSLVTFLRSASLALVVIAALLATFAWAVRSRRLSPFSTAARFVRRSVDPLLGPFDRRLAPNGVPAAAVPWWALLFILLAGAALIFVVTFVRDAFVGAYFAVNAGPRGLVALAIRWTFGVLQLALLVRVVTSWVGGAHSGVGRLAFRLTEWFLAPLRRVLPSLGSVDLSPMVAWFVLNLVQGAFLTML